VGNAREIVAWTGGGVVVPTESMSDGRKTADTAAAARLVADMLAHPEQAAGLGRSGRRHWMESFCWETIAEKYEAVYRDAIAAASKTAVRP
jgi:glycosyltransferase involved in cell wall biosynthesis